MATCKVKILQDTMAGGEFVKAGKEIEITRRDAHLLTNIGRAEYIDRNVKAEDLTDREMKSDNTVTSKGKNK